MRLHVLVLIAFIFGVSVFAESYSDNMILVEEGTFQMGSNSNPKNINYPEHKVNIDAFYISKIEVTLDWFSRFIEDTKYITYLEKRGSTDWFINKKWQDNVPGNWRNVGFFQKEDEPVTCIMWADAIIFCNWLSEKEGFDPVYSINGDYDYRKWPEIQNIKGVHNGWGDLIKWDNSKNGYRLPTEAEWEYAAQGGIRSKKYIYSGGNNLDEISWYGGNSNQHTNSVGTKKPNEIGIYDMSGNIREMVWDYFSRYTGETLDNPKGGSKEFSRVAKGGSWFGGPAMQVIQYTPQFRDYGPEVKQYDNGTGFRIAKNK